MQELRKFEGPLKIGKLRFELYCEECNIAYTKYNGKCLICLGELTRVAPGRYIGPKQRRRIFKRDGYRCVKCQSRKRLTIDHVKPVSKGGNNKDYNLQTMCEKCNSEKADKSIFDE
jgi:hypothetical protein